MDKADWEERNQTGVLETKEKEMKERKRKTLCLFHVDVFLSAVETYYLWNEDIKDVMNRMHSG